MSAENHSGALLEGIEAALRRAAVRARQTVKQTVHFKDAKVGDLDVVDEEIAAFERGVGMA